MLTGITVRLTRCVGRRATVNGGDVPTYHVSRHPVHGGFIMQSCWVLYTAFPMPPKGSDPHLQDSALEVGFEQQSAEAIEYNTTTPGHDGAVELVQDRVGIGGDMALVSVGGMLTQMPRQIAAALVASGFPAADVGASQGNA